jgi:cytosine deaminase
VSFQAPTAIPSSPVRLAHARLADGRLVDVHLADGVVRDITPAPAGAAEPAPGVLDLAGRLLLTAPAEPHAHLDKALTFDAIQPPLGDLPSAIAAWVGYAGRLTVHAVVERASTQALALLANGTTAVRSHADLHPGGGTIGVEALVRLRAELAGLMDLQVVAFPHWRTEDDEIAAAMELGVDLVGGAPHHAPDPLAQVERTLTFAEKYGVGVDLHTDERLAGPVSLDHFARLLRDLPHTPGSAASHCVRLATLPAAEREAVIADVRRSDLAVIALPATNLYLQGRDHPDPVPRAIPPLRQLIDAGVRVAAGADNVRDPFNPVGRSDAFETASLLVTAAHLTPDEAWHLVSDGARSAMGLPPAGPRIGAVADLLAIPATSLVQAIAEAPADRIVLHRGRVVAQTTVTREVAIPTSRSPD